jgi:hypothetical protein
VRDLLSQRALAQRGDAPAQGLEGLGLVDPRELAAKAVQVAKDALVDDADQSEQLQQGIL